MLLAVIAILTFSFIFLIFYLGASRTEKARKRLQACIDNGKVQFDGDLIMPTDGISESDRQKIEREIEIFIKAKHGLNVLYPRLRRKKSTEEGEK